MRVPDISPAAAAPPHLCINVISWNVTNMRSAARIANIISEATSWSNDPIILLNSTGCPPSILKAVINQQLPGYTTSACFDKNTSRSGGTAILLPPHLGCRAHPCTHFGGLLTLQTLNTTPPTLIGSIYWPPTVSQAHTPLQKLNMLNFLRHKLAQALAHHHHIILGGDFNSWPSPLDVSNERPTHSQAHGALHHLMEVLSLNDSFRILHPTAQEFTFPAHLRQDQSQSRLDYIFVSSSLLPCTTNASIIPHLGELSDHCPISVTIHNPTLTDTSALQAQQLALRSATRQVIDYNSITSKQWEAYASELSDTLDTSLNSPDLLWVHYHKQIKLAARHHLPWRRSSAAPKLKKSPTPRLDRAIKAFRKSVLHRSDTTDLALARSILFRLPLALRHLYSENSETPQTCTVVALIRQQPLTSVSRRDCSTLLKFLY